jgi:hypothetical protein
MADYFRGGRIQPEQNDAGWGEPLRVLSLEIGLGNDSNRADV